MAPSGKSSASISAKPSAISTQEVLRTERLNIDPYALAEACDYYSYKEDDAEDEEEEEEDQHVQMMDVTCGDYDVYGLAEGMESNGAVEAAESLHVESDSDEDCSDRASSLPDGEGLGRDRRWSRSRSPRRVVCENDPYMREGGGSKWSPAKKDADELESSSTEEREDSSEEGSGDSDDAQGRIVIDKAVDIEGSGGTYALPLKVNFRIEAILGDGTFGRVLLARDSDNGEVAIKVIRDKKRHVSAAKVEAKILRKVSEAAVHDPSAGGVARYFGTFWLQQAEGPRFYSLVFERLGKSVYEFLKDNSYRGFLMEDIQQMAQQCCEALRFLHKDELRLIHTDLKPENIVLVRTEADRVEFPNARNRLWLLGGDGGNNEDDVGAYLRPRSAHVKLIDFGAAIEPHHRSNDEVCTRQYRPPEVTLRMNWDEKLDIWSLGCILMELYTGDQLFATREVVEHLALIEHIVGGGRPESWPQEMLEAAVHLDRRRDPAAKCADGGQYFEQTARGPRLRFPAGARDPARSRRHVARQKAMQEQVLPEHREFADFCSSLLRLPPSERLSAADALDAPFLNPDKAAAALEPEPWSDEDEPSMGDEAPEDFVGLDAFREAFAGAVNSSESCEDMVSM